METRRKEILNLRLCRKKVYCFGTGTDPLEFCEKNLLGMDGFRVVCDLSEILDGIRKRSFLYVNIEQLSTIRDLCFRIKACFNIKENVVLMIDDVYLPFRENIKILRADDIIKVVLIDSSSSYTRTSTEITPQSNELNHVNGNVLPQIAEEIIHAYGETTEIVNGSINDISLHKPRNRKRKKQTNICENSSQSDIQVLTEIISDNSEVIALETPLTKKNKRNRRQKHTDIRPDEENVVQELAGLIPETGADVPKQPSAEEPNGESIAVIPTGDLGPNSVSRKRKRIRIRKKKAATDMPPESNSYHNHSYERAMNPYAKAFSNQGNQNLSHIRFSSSTSNVVKYESLDYNPIEDDLLVKHDESVQANSTTEKNGSEIDGIKSGDPKIIAPENGKPLVVRRARIDSVQSPAAKVRKFLQNPPEVNDIITFKIWKMDQNYCPQISGLIKAKVLNFCNDSQQVRFFILDGKSHCEQPNGKFSLDTDFTEDGPSVPQAVPDIMELNWQEMLEVEIFL